MSVDVAGPQKSTADPRVHYGVREDAHIAYTANAEPRHLVTRHENGHIVVRDAASGVEATGSSYLEALRALSGSQN